MRDVKILENLTIATMSPGDVKYGLIEQASLVVSDHLIDWVGPSLALPEEYRVEEYQDAPRHDFAGRLMTPAMIDCHTHLVYGGNRAHEFQMRLDGVSYEEISRQGGGIKSTVKMTRETSAQDLLTDALRRVDRLLADGVSTIEVKSGYGLDIETELKMLRVARQIPDHRTVEVKTTFLGAHAVPAGMNADEYIDQICIPALTQAHAENLVDAVDGFCETIGFSPTQLARVYDVAQSLNLPVKCHAEQLSNYGGIELATRYQALSTDHVEFANETDIANLAAHDCVAVLLPGAFYALRETRKPPVDLMRQHKVAMAVATDCNPGSSPLSSLLLAMNMACIQFQLTPEEALAGTTRHAAKALGLTDRGIIQAGMRADLAIWDASEPAELSYHIGLLPLHHRFFAGQAVAPGQ